MPDLVTVLITWEDDDHYDVQLIAEGETPRVPSRAQTLEEVRRELDPILSDHYLGSQDFSETLRTGDIKISYAMYPWLVVTVPKELRAETGEFMIFDVNGEEGHWDARFPQSGISLVTAVATDLDTLADEIERRTQLRWPQLEGDVPGMMYWARSLDAAGFHAAPRL